jgi:hypothetical protein
MFHFLSSDIHGFHLMTDGLHMGTDILLQPERKQKHEESVKYIFC